MMQLPLSFDNQASIPDKAVSSNLLFLKSAFFDLWVGSNLTKMLAKKKGLRVKNDTLPLLSFTQMLALHGNSHVVEEKHWSILGIYYIKQKIQ